MAEGVSDLIEALAVPERRAEAVERLAQMGEAAVPSLIQALDHKTDFRVSEAAARVLGKIGPAAVAPLVVALGSPVSCVRFLAARTLGELGPEARAAVPALLQALQDPHSEVCCRAAEALGRIDPETSKAVPPEVRELQEESVRVRGAAMDLIAAPLGDEDEQELEEGR